MVLFFALTAWGCTSKQRDTNQAQSKQATPQAANDSGLTPFQMKNGIGPVTQEVKVGPLNKQLAEKGKEIFENNCASCHKIGQRYVGPDLQQVTSRRTPTYIMNMILNPEEMTQKHPVAHKLLEQNSTQMANMHLTEQQARAVVEYFRSLNPNIQK